MKNDYKKLECKKPGIWTEDFFVIFFLWENLDWKMCLMGPAGPLYSYFSSSLLHQRFWLGTT